jgi:hypothetical protein
MERTGIILECNIPACGRQEFVVADDVKQAELKSGLVADPAWDFGYVTISSTLLTIGLSRPIPPHLMVHAIPFHPRNAVAIPKDLAFAP